MKNKKEKNRKAGVLTGILVCVIFGLLILANTGNVIVENSISVLREPFLVTGGVDPGVTGLCYFRIYPHQADPDTAYASNLTNASSYEYSTTGNTSATGETPFNTAFDIVIKIGINDDDGMYTGNSTWADGYVWMLLTCADLSIDADTNMSWVEIDYSNDYRYLHFYLNNAGSGYTIAEGASFNVTSAKLYVQRIV